MLGVSYMGAQLGPGLSILCFAVAALISAECGRLVVRTCDMVDDSPSHLDYVVQGPTPADATQEELLQRM